jgi:hypothetical protein
LGLYLAESNSNRLLAVTCRHVLIASNTPNTEYTHHDSGPANKVLVLGEKAYDKLVDSINARIDEHTINTEVWSEQIEGFVQREEDNDPIDAEEAGKDRAEVQALLDTAKRAIKALEKLRNDVEKHWSKLNNRVLGTVLHSPPICLGVGDRHFTQDWGVVLIDRAKLGPGFKGNVIDLGTSTTIQLRPSTNINSIYIYLGTKLSASQFTAKCFPRGDANWKFKYPRDGLLPLQGTIPDKQMRAPDMWDHSGYPCLLVVKHGNATGTTLGCANGVNSIIREYNMDMSVAGSSMEWTIMPYDSKSSAFSEPGDYGSIIADIRGRIGGILTGGAGKTKSSDMTYATPWDLVLQQIRASEFPCATVDIGV